MATKTEIQLIDDLDGVTTEGVETYRFVNANDGQWYEIDLSPTSHEAVFGTLDRIIGHGRPIDAPTFKKVAKRNAGGRSKSELAAIRQWAVEQGYQVSERGRLSRSVLEAYSNSQGAPVLAEVEPANGKKSKRAKVA